MDRNIELWLATREAVQKSIREAERTALREEHDNSLDTARKLDRIKSHSLTATRLFFYPTLLTDHRPDIRKTKNARQWSLNPS